MSASDLRILDVDELHRRISALPFPIASVLELYLTDTDNKDRIEDLLHAFEAIAEFSASVLLAGLLRDRESLARHWESIRGPGRGVSHALRTSSFGTWVMLGTTLTVVVNREMRGGRAGPIAAAYGLATAGPLEGLASRQAWEVLEKAKIIRNSAKGHDPRLTPADRAAILRELESLLLELLPNLERAFSSWELVRLGGARIRQGVLGFDARRLTGAPRAFRPTLIEVTQVLETDGVYMYDPGGSAPLPLGPFIQLVQDEARGTEACYFYDRIENEETRWKLYHTGADSSLSFPMPALLDLLSFLDQGPDRTLPTPEADVVARVPATADVEAEEDRGFETDPLPDPAVDRPSASELDAVGQTAFAVGVQASGFLVGTALARAMYPIVKREDPAREGRSVEAWLTLAEQAGIAIPGDKAQKLRSAFNITQHLYTRPGRGTWTWVSHDAALVADGLSGSELRDEAYDVARVLDPNRRGIHYEAIKAELLRRGVAIAGPSQGRRVWAAIGSPSGSRRFRALGEGNFAWTAEGEAAPEVAAESRQPLRVPAGLGGLAGLAELLDSRLLAGHPSIGRNLGEDEIVYLAAAEPIARLEVHRSRLRIVVDEPLASTPHVAGVVVRQLALPGQPSQTTESWLSVADERSIDAAALLVAARAARARHAYLDPGYRREVDRARALGRTAFAPGWGSGDRPAGNLAGEALASFWAGLISRFPSVAGATRTRAPKGRRLGSSGAGGVYRTLRVDEFGVLATYWTATGHEPNAAGDDLEARCRAIGEALGHPVVVMSYAAGTWIADRVYLGALDDAGRWPEVWAACDAGLAALLEAAATIASEGA